MALSLITWFFELDFAGDASYNTNVRSRLDDGIEVELDRLQAEDGTPQVSELVLDLDNSDGAFNYQLPSAEYFGKMKKGLRVRVRSTHLATTRTLWTGRVVDWDYEGEGPDRRCILSCIDNLAWLAEVKHALFTSSASRATDDAVEAVLTAAGFTSSDWTIDSTSDTLPLHFATDQDALAQVMAAVRASWEGQFYCLKDGKFRFRSPANMAHGSITHTWGDSTSVTPSEIIPRLRLDAQKSKVECEHGQFVTGTAGAIIVFSHPKNRTNGLSVVIPTGATGITFDCAYSLPVHALTAPVVTTDYLANDAADGSGTNRSATLTVTAVDHGDHASVTITTSHGSNVYLTMFQLRADVLIYKHPTSLSAGNAQLIAAGKTIEFDAKYLSVQTAMTALVSGTDYKGNTNQSGTGTDRTANMSVSVTDLGVLARVRITNTHATDGIYFSLQIRGAAVQLTRGEALAPPPTIRGIEEPFSGSPQTITEKLTPQQLSYELAVSNLPGSPTEQIPQPFRDASAPLPMTLYGRLRVVRQLQMHLTVIFDWTDDAIVTAMLTAELFDLVRLRDNSSSVNHAWLSNVDEWFRIVGIKHVVSPGEAGMSEVQLAPSWLWPWECEFRDEFTGSAGAIVLASPNGEVYADVTSFKFQLNGSGKAVVVSTGHDTCYMVGANHGADFEMGAILGGLADGVIIGFGYRGSSTPRGGFIVAIDGVGTDRVIFLAYDNGTSYSTLAAENIVNPGDEHEVTVRVVDNEHRVYVDGFLYINEVNSNVPTADVIRPLWTNSSTIGGTVDELYVRNL